MGRLQDRSPDNDAFRGQRGECRQYEHTANREGRLDAWLDINRDGTWSNDEQIIDGVRLLDGNNELTVNLPGNVVAGPTFARFRYSSAGISSPEGSASDGEVEDYATFLSDNPWHNYLNAFDVSGDGEVSPVDALLLIDHLNTVIDSGPLPLPAPLGNSFLDVNGDSFASPVDALRVINLLNSSPAGEASTKTQQPNTARAASLTSFAWPDENVFTARPSGGEDDHAIDSDVPAAGARYAGSVTRRIHEFDRPRVRPEETVRRRAGENLAALDETLEETLDAIGADALYPSRMSPLDRFFARTRFGR